MVEAIKQCRACKSIRLIEFLNLGEQYLSDFREDNKRTPKYPLVVLFCEDCKLVQLKHTTPQSEMYHERYGFKSGISKTISDDLNDIVTHAFQYKNDPQSWLDIASNDGTLLSYVPRNIFRVGVDPVGFLCKEAQDHADVIVNDYFSDNTVGGEFDVITSVSCFYDMPDPSKFVSDVVSVLADKGVWVIQQNYLFTTMELGAVDNFCHEHIEYYTLMSLENLLDRFGLEVNEVGVSPVNGGSIRTVVSRKGTFPVDFSVNRQRAIEWVNGLDTVIPYYDFAQRVTVELDKLSFLIRNLHRQGKTISILAASTRGATIWQSAKIGPKYIKYAVERNPQKVGAMFSAINVPIISEAQFHRNPTDYAIVGPWFYADEIIDRESEYLKDHNVIIPLPELRII